LDSNHIPSCTSAGSVIESIFENTIMKTLLGLYTGNSILKSDWLYLIFCISNCYKDIIVDLSMFYFPLKKLIRKYAMENLIHQGTEMFRINIISKLPMKNERIWTYVKETTSHLQIKLTKNIHLGVTTSTWPPFSWKYKLN
jgi:hypothetical protein